MGLAEVIGPDVGTVGLVFAGTGIPPDEIGGGVDQADLLAVRLEEGDEALVNAVGRDHRRQEDDDPTRLAPPDLAEGPEPGGFGLAPTGGGDRNDVAPSGGALGLESPVTRERFETQLGPFATTSLVPRPDVILHRRRWHPAHDSAGCVERVVPSLRATGHPVGGH